METTKMAEAGSLWYLELGGWVFLCQQNCNYRIGSIVLHLIADEGQGDLFNEASELAALEPCSNNRGQWWVIVVGNSLLQGRCQPDLLYRSVYCLPADQIQDINERLPRLAQPLDYALLLIHIRTMLWYWQRCCFSNTSVYKYFSYVFFHVYF